MQRLSIQRPAIVLDDCYAKIINEVTDNTIPQSIVFPTQPREDQAYGNKPQQADNCEVNDTKYKPRDVDRTPGRCNA